jgi:hypothetical protein
MLHFCVIGLLHTGDASLLKKNVISSDSYRSLITGIIPASDSYRLTTV